MPTEEGNPVVNEVAEQVTAPTDSTTVETKAPILDEDGIDISFAQNDGSEEADETPTESNPEPESEEATEEAEVTEEEQDKPTKAEARKEQLNTEIRDLVALRNQIRQEVEAKHAEVYKPATVDELTEQVNPETGDYYNRLEAKLEAIEQQRQVETYNNQVAEARLSLTTDASRAVADFPIFDETSPNYIPTLAAQVDRQLASALVIDPNTNEIIGSRESPYNLYKAAYDAYMIGQQRASANGQKAVTSMMNNVDIPSSAPTKPSSTKDDSKLDADAYAKKYGLKMHEY